MAGYDMIGNYAGGAATTTLGVYQYFSARKALKKLLTDRVPEYTENPTMGLNRQRAAADATFGFSGQEKAAYYDRQAMVANTRYNRAVNMAGGNLAGAINAGIGYGNIHAAGDFATRNAALQREKIRYSDTFGRNLQSIQDRNTANAYSYRIKAEMALGQAMQAGTNNIATGFAMGTSSGGQGASQQKSSGGNDGSYAAPNNSSYGYSGYGDVDTNSGGYGGGSYG